MCSIGILGGGDCSSVFVERDASLCLVIDGLVAIAFLLGFDFDSIPPIFGLPQSIVYRWPIFSFQVQNLDTYPIKC